MNRFPIVLAALLLCTPAFAAPPTVNMDSPPPASAAILYCANTASGPPYIAYPADATHNGCLGSGGGGGGGAVTVAEGADITEGTPGDTHTQGTVVGFLKDLWTNFFATPVAIKVDGSAVTQPVSAASLPLPAGASTSALQTTGNTSLGTIATNTTGSATATAQATNTAAIQETHATAGSDASKAEAVQGVTGMKPLKVDGSAVTQPISAASNIPVSQTTAANLNATVVGAGSSSAASGGSLSVNPDSVVDGTTTTASASSATTVLTFANTQGYGYIQFGFSAVGGGATVVVDCAADGSTYNTQSQFWNIAGNNTAVPSLATPTTAMQFVVPVTCQAMRIRLSLYTSGTYTAYGSLKRGAVPQPTALVPQGLANALGDGRGNAPIIPSYAAASGAISGISASVNYGYAFNGSSWDRVEGAQNGTNSTGTGIAAAAGVAQCDDVSPQAITENSFGNMRFDCSTHDLIVNVEPSTSHGWTAFTLTLANSTNATNIKASAGTLGHVSAYGTNATPIWVSFYNTSGTPTCGTSIVWQVLIPANSTSGAGAVDDVPAGLNFSSGIGMCAATGINGVGSVAASSYVVNVASK